MTANLFANITLEGSDDNLALFFSRLTLIGGGLLPLAYLFFALAFSGQYRKISKTKKILFTVPVALLLSTTFTDLNAKMIDGELASGVSYLMIIIIFIIYFSYGTYILAKSYSSSSSQERLQLQYIFLGITFSVIPGLFLNAVLPAMGYTEPSYYGSIVVIFFAIFTSVAIVKHKLFDLRGAIARFIAYILLVATFGGIYSLVVFGLANRLLGTDSVFTQQIIPIITAVFLVFTAPFFKKLFDKITNRFFYQDAYDPQVLMDELNQVLISNMELSILLRRASEVIQKHIKSVRCVVAVHQSEDTPLRIAGTEKMSLTMSGSAHFANEMHKIHQSVIFTDELGSSHSKLKKMLRDADMALAVKMRSGVEATDDLAYLLLGPKRSGNMYGNRDIKTIEIIADSMVIAIQNALRFEEIQGFAAVLQERVDEATAKLKKTNAKLRALDETKDEFISMASHQLRTPLTSVKGYLSMVLEGDVGKVDPKQQKLLNQAFVSSQRMVYLIADLLNVSRLKTGKFVITPSPTDLSEMVQSEIEQLKEAAKSKDIKLTYKKPAKLTLLNLDETKTRQVVMNFADNAIYYTQVGGKIDIEVREDANNVYVIVKDNGIGIPKEEQNKLFGKFFRASNAKNVRPDGTGLGLFMAKKVVSAQGGSIIFESTVGKGSTFGFSFSKSKLRIGQE